ncbi:hypothetical protein [Streptomyces sp. NBC_01092]|uniref:hypothetical protein n=1 Tax=Streptomyces sp. NBC_01092 TaxID=2903748 RepID=UPI00386C98A9
MLSTVLLAVVGVALLSLPQEQESPAPAAPSIATADPSAAVRASEAGRATIGPTMPSAAAETPSGFPSVLPPHGDGAAGDQAVQRSLEAAWPADLPTGDERELLSAGRALLRADATGIGRAKWPNAFPNSGQVMAPAFAPARFRIQAAIARRDGSPNQAVVHLVWAGQDRGGTYTDLRITDLSFTRVIKKGTATWTPQPRT